MTNRKQIQRSNISFIKQSLTEGKFTFTTKDFVLWSGKSIIASRAFLRRLIKNKTIASPVRGFFVIIPPEYSSIGCLPPEQFVEPLMQYLGQKYYVGLLSAFSLYGISHQQPQFFYVVTEKKRATVICGKVKIVFIQKKNVENIPVNDFKTQRGFIKVSNIESTIIDLFLYLNSVGGLNNISTIIKELNKKLDINKVIKLAPNLSILQRLGYLLDRILKKHKLSNPIKTFLDKNKVVTTPLIRTGKRSGFKTDEKWNILINTSIEAD